jgi:hypothetical protein
MIGYGLHTSETETKSSECVAYLKYRAKSVDRMELSSIFKTIVYFGGDRPFKI